jgi:hypothetical protein
MPLRVLVGCEMSGRVRDAFAQRGWEAWSADLLPSESPDCDYRSVSVVPGDGDIIDGKAGGIARHYQGDCRDLFTITHPVNARRGYEILHRHMSTAPGGPLPLWDLIIAHPPCNDLSYAGARWFKAKQADGRQQTAADFFMSMVYAPSPLTAIENPHSVMQKLYRYPDQVVQPWMFGDPYVKGIHLWLKGLPELVPTHAEGDYPELFRVATGGGSWRTDKAAERRLMSAYEDGEGRVNRARVRSRTFKGLAAAMAGQWGAFAEGYYRERDLR